MKAILQTSLVLARLGVGLLLPLGLVYAWLWLFAHVGVQHGPIAALLVLFAGSAALFIFVRGTRHNPFGFYQPWDNGYWILAQEMTGHWWQRPARNGAS